MALALSATKAKCGAIGSARKPCVAGRDRGGARRLVLRVDPVLQRNHTQSRALRTTRASAAPLLNVRTGAPEAVQERLVSARLLLPLRGARPAELPFRLHRLETRHDGRRRLGARFKGLAVLLEQRRRMRVLRQFVRTAVSLPPVSVLQDPMWSVRTGGLDEGLGIARQVLLSLLERPTETRTP
ncbi:hypothetical protein HPB51_004477 [Rhipicephalus microplus]|uniref:Uncharacterized protein n=1 Tax=Rhipicephalus microplus TaxID=6941 RepID=A0A9J6EM70_RHIMP|nr:hypothetical protein HPB51_004477 [Rhipicephalus microplus]